MKPRECPFCGKKPEKYRSTWYVCKECEIDVPVEVWDYRHDDWRSDGWPEGEVLVLYRGHVYLGELDIENMMVRIFYDNSLVSILDCKWKPLPEGGES